MALGKRATSIDILHLKKRNLVNVQSFSIFSLQNGHKIDILHQQLIILWSRSFYFLLLSVCKVAVSLNHQLIRFLQEYL